MSKQTIAWHEECLANSREYYHRKKQMAIKDIEECNEAFDRNLNYACQIEEAKRRGMDAFDRDKFMKKRETPKI